MSSRMRKRRNARAAHVASLNPRKPIRPARDWKMACSYGAHTWRLDLTYPRFPHKVCTVCGGVYQASGEEVRILTATQGDTQP